MSPLFSALTTNHGQQYVFYIVFISYTSPITLPTIYPLSTILRIYIGEFRFLPSFYYYSYMPKNHANGRPLGIDFLAAPHGRAGVVSRSCVCASRFVCRVRARLSATYNSYCRPDGDGVERGLTPARKKKLVTADKRELGTRTRRPDISCRRDGSPPQSNSGFGSRWYISCLERVDADNGDEYIEARARDAQFAAIQINSLF